VVTTPFQPAVIVNAREAGGMGEFAARGLLPLAALAALLVTAAYWDHPAPVGPAARSGGDVAFVRTHGRSLSQVTRELAQADEEADETGDNESWLSHKQYRQLDDQLGDAGSGSGELGSGSSGKGSGDESSGDLSPSPSPPSASPPSASPSPPSPTPPPSPPFSPGVSFVEMVVTRIVLELTLDETVESFDAAKQEAFSGQLGTSIGCVAPACRIQLEIYAASIVVRSIITVDEASDADADAIADSATALADKTPAELSTELGVTVESVGSVSVETGVRLLVAVAPPPPPMTPPSSPDEGLSGAVIAIIIVVVVLVLLVVAILLYKRSAGGKMSDMPVDGGGKSGAFPMTIGASTTQHV